MQHKGESECALYPGVTDEGCTFEKAPNAMGFNGSGLSSIDYARGALKEGLLFEERTGTNPLAFGHIGSTDTHLGTPGLVAERGHPGHGGAGKPGNTVLEVPGLPDIPELNPGGLAVVWAEENSRDAIFAAMQRRETYATSGTRPALRLFAGWDFPASVCERDDVAAAGYAGGVPMGGVLSPRPSGGAAPTLLVTAARDPHENGGDLERIEIVKGWVEGGEAREAVFTVAGGDRPTEVDLATCLPTGQAYKTLCSVWRDPDFAPEQRAFYYARLREALSCRWTQWACVDAGVSCQDDEPDVPGYEPCCEETVARTIQERAWSSPVWYRP